MHAGGPDAELAPGFLRIIVGNCVTVRDAAQSVSHAGTVQHAFDKAGFSVAAVSQKANVADFAGCITHVLFLPYSINFFPIIIANYTY
jgi:hypothetical protein